MKKKKKSKGREMRKKIFMRTYCTCMSRWVTKRWMWIILVTFFQGDNKEKKKDLKKKNKKINNLE